LLRRWADWAEAEVASWDNTSDPDVFRRAIDQLPELLDSLPA
jgi:hypothetical protein